MQRDLQIQAARIRRLEEDVRILSQKGAPAVDPGKKN